VAVSPIVGGQALRGPAGDMLRTLGHDASALGVARIYAGQIDGFVVDRIDEGLADAIAALGPRVLVTNTVMQTEDDRATLARDVLDFATTLSG
jgi:LPPG:FO 2-phospho-L-lactate transferase